MVWAVRIFLQRPWGWNNDCAKFVDRTSNQTKGKTVIVLERRWVVLQRKEPCTSQCYSNEKIKIMPWWHVIMEMPEWIICHGDKETPRPKGKYDPLTCDSIGRTWLDRWEHIYQITLACIIKRYGGTLLATIMLASRQTEPKNSAPTGSQGSAPGPNFI